MAHDSKFTAKRLVNGPRQYKPYPAYRDSDVEWLGRIPEHWNKKRLKFFAPFRTTKLNVETKDATYVGLENIESWTGRFLLDSQLQSPQGSITQFHAGDVLFGKLRPYLAKAACPDFNGVSTSELLVFRPDGCLPRYLLYLFLNEQYVQWIDRLTYGTRMPRVGPEQVGDSFAPLPPLEEQRVIAGFLDRETEKIDALVAKKQRLIELLSEKRAALIAQAVSRGLDPDVPMKESGFPWLGEIPVGWGIRRLKNIVRKIGSGKTPAGGAERYVAEGVMLLRSQNIQFGGLELTDVACIDDTIDNEMSGSRVAENDVLLNITGASLGRCCVARLDGLRANVNQHVCIVRPDPHQVDAAFLARSLESRTLQDQIFNNENGVSRDALNFEQIGALLLSFPTIDDQRAIAAFLDRETGKIDALLAQVREAIDRLTELRTALISTAVTGKIDVRGPGA